MCWQMFSKTSNIKLYENLLSHSRVIMCGQRGGQGEDNWHIFKLLVASAHKSIIVFIKFI